MEPTVVIAYSNRRLYMNLFMGIAWGSFSIIKFNSTEKIDWTAYGLLILGICYIAMFIYEYTQKYLLIDKDKIRENSLPSKEILMDEIKEVNYFAGDFVFKGGRKSIRITKSQINQKQLPEFEDFFNKLSERLKETIR